MLALLHLMPRKFVFLALLLFLSVITLVARMSPVAAFNQPSTDPREEALALINLSQEQNQKDHVLALQTAQQALGLLQNLSDTEGMALAYAQVARCYLAHFDLAEATQNYEEALQLYQKLDQPMKQADILINLAFVENRKGEWSNAIALYTQAESILTGTAEPELRGAIAGGLGHVFTENGLPETARIQYQRALNYYRETPQTRDDNRMTMLIGYTYYLSQDYSQALTNIQEALASFGPTSLDAAQCHLYLGKVYTAIHENAAALEHLELALPLYLQARNPQEAAQTRALMGQAQEQLGDLGRARRTYEESLNVFLNLSDRMNQAAVYYMLGRLDLRQKHYDAAADNLERSLAITESVRLDSASTELTAAYSATVHERYETYIECLMRKHAAQPNGGFAVKAFELSERSRARSLVDLLQATRTNLASRLDPQLAQQEKSLRQSLRAKEDYEVKLLGSSYEQEELSSVRSELARLRTENEELAKRIKERSPAYAEITDPTVWDLQRIREKVIDNDQKVLLEYFLGAERSYLWAVTRNEIISYELPGRATINEAANRVYKLSAVEPAETSDALNQASQALSRIVLSPVAARLKQHQVIIVADGVLNYIPFQTLPPDPANNEPLIAESEVVNAPSASILGQLRGETARRQPTKLLAAFGDPRFAPGNLQRTSEATTGDSVAARSLNNDGWRPALRDIGPRGESRPVALRQLFYARRELNNLARAASGSGSETLIALDYDATRERLQATDLSKYKMLHIATHGSFDAVRPEQSGLMLSTIDRDGKALDGFLGLKDIYNLHAPVDLVVLSACGSGLGENVSGEGLIGLTRGFMYAGASSVVASLWEVDDRATAELMKRFYTNMLQREMTPAAALRAAQNSIRNEPRWSSPYYWAAFTLQGEYTQKINPKAAAVEPGYANAILFSGLAILFVFMGWSYRRHFGR